MPGGPHNARCACCAACWKVVLTMLTASEAQKFTFDLKAHMLALSRPAAGVGGARLPAVPVSAWGGRLIDVRVARWLLHPDSGASRDNPTGADKSKARISAQLDAPFQCR